MESPYVTCALFCHSVTPVRQPFINSISQVAQESVDSATSSGSDVERSTSHNGNLPRLPAVTIAAIRHPVAADMELMNSNLRALAADRGGPTMEAAAAQIFGAGGKKLRPMIVLLVARATAHIGGLRYTCLIHLTAPWGPAAVHVL